MTPVDRRLGRFVIRHKLGRGGMADVYLAIDTHTNKVLALKLVEHGIGEDLQLALDAERRGVQLQRALSAIDPRVVQIYDSGDMDGYFFVAMEYIEGEDLAELIRRGPVPIRDAARIASEICDTLEHAHSLDVMIEGKPFRGMVHGDIKPNNIRIDPHGQVRLLDFGIAKALSLSRRLTRNDFGSVAYASPERLDSGEVDSLSDLWSVAVVLYEMESGYKPFRAESTSKLENIIRSRVPPALPPDTCPEPMRRIIAQALAPEPWQRYQSAAEIRDDLRAFLSGQPVKAVYPSEDGDATRRTHPADYDGNETRRTTPRDPVRPARPGRPSPAPLMAAASPWRTLRRVIALLLLGAMMYWVGSSYAMYKRGRELERQINAELLTDIDEIWKRWQDVAKENTSSVLLYPARHSVEKKFLAAADHTIASYRNENQVVYQKDWDRAHQYLQRALTMDPGDDEIRAKLRLCEGHVARINGLARHSLGPLNEAVDDFQEAAKLMPKSPDPLLGLARVYIYGFKEIDKADETLRRAEKLGWRMGKREKGQLADGYRVRADEIWSESEKLANMPQERDQLKRAREDYQRAIQLYQDIVPFGNAATALAAAQTGLNSVELRLKDLDGGHKFWP